MSARQGLCRNTWSFFAVNIIMLSRKCPINNPVVLLYIYYNQNKEEQRIEMLWKGNVQ